MTVGRPNNRYMRGKMSIIAMLRIKKWGAPFDCDLMSVSAWATFQDLIDSELGAYTTHRIALNKLIKTWQCAREHMLLQMRPSHMKDPRKEKRQGGSGRRGEI